MSSGLIIVGKVSGHFGIRGWVKLLSYTEPRDQIFSYGKLWVNGVHCELKESRVQGRQLLARFEGYDLREQSEALIGQHIGIEKSQLPELESDEYYWCDLIGLLVEDQNRNRLGKITSVFATGANDVLVVAADGEEILVPYIPGDVIKKVNLAAGSMEVDWEEPV